MACKTKICRVGLGFGLLIEGDEGCFLVLSEVKSRNKETYEKEFLLKISYLQAGTTLKKSKIKTLSGTK